MSKESLHKRAEAIGLNHLADKVELAGKLEKPEMIDAEIAKIGQEIYDKWTAAGLTLEDLKYVTVNGTIDYKRIEELVERKKLRQSPLEVTAMATEAKEYSGKIISSFHLDTLKKKLESGEQKMDDDVRSQLKAHNMSDAEIESMLRAKNLALRGDGLYALKDKIQSGQQVLKALRNTRDGQKNKLAQDFGGVIANYAYGLELTTGNGLPMLIETVKALQTASPATYLSALELLKHEPNVFCFSTEVMTETFKPMLEPDMSPTIPSVLDLPFKRCLIEMYCPDSQAAGSQVTIYHSFFKGVDGDIGNLISCPIEEAEIKVSVPVVFIEERSATEYEVIGILQAVDLGRKPAELHTLFPFMVTLKDGFVTNMRPTTTAVSDPILSGIIFNSLKALLGRFSNLADLKGGTVKTNIRAKIKSSGQTYIHKIKHIVYLVKRVGGMHGKTLNGEPVDWSHRWEVRGHWRTIRGIGKNRDGEQNVRGFTWVIPHVKGDESLPLIKKIRADLPPKEETL